MLPEYIIYDELKRQREREQSDDRPQLEIPRYMPYWPDDEPEEGEREERQDDSEVIIIQM